MCEHVRVCVCNCAEQQNINEVNAMATKAVRLEMKQNPHKCCTVSGNGFTHFYNPSLHSSFILPLSVVLHLGSCGSPASFFGSSVALLLSSGSEFSLGAGLDGPDVEAKSEPARATPPTISELPAVCMIFCLTSRIFSCRHSLLGNVSE